MASAITAMPLARPIEAIRMHDHGPHIMGSLMQNTWVGFERSTTDIERVYGRHGRGRRAIKEEISCDFRTIYDSNLTRDMVIKRRNRV